MASSIERILTELEHLSREEREELENVLSREVRARRKGLRQNGSSLSIDLRDELRWIDEHREEYAGQWVAVRGNQLLSSGADGLSVYRAARQAGDDRPFVTLVEPVQELPFAGW
jgi:hypothetical protein